MEELINIINERFDRLEKLECIKAKDLLRAEEVSLLTGLTIQDIYDKNRKGMFGKSYKPGNKTIYFEKEGVLKWMRSNQMETDASIEAEAAAFCDDNPSKI